MPLSLRLEFQNIVRYGDLLPTNAANLLKELIFLLKHHALDYKIRPEMKFNFLKLIDNAKNSINFGHNAV